MIADPQRPPKDGSMGIRRSDELRFRARSLSRDLFKRPLLRRRHCDGYVACMHQAGSHWVRYMLALTLARLYDLPPPAHIRDLSIVGIQANSAPESCHRFRADLDAGKSPNLSRARKNSPGKRGKPRGREFPFSRDGFSQSPVFDRSCLPLTFTLPKGLRRLPQAAVIAG